MQQPKMAVRCRCLNLFLVLGLGILLFRTSSLADEICTEHLWNTVHSPTNVLTCTNIRTVEDVQILTKLLNHNVSSIILRLQDCAVDQFTDDFFNDRPITSLYVISSSLLEIPHRLVSSICGRTLKILWIIKNRIAHIPDGRFLGCSMIRSLDLSANGILTVSRLAFQDLVNLQELNLQFNNIRVFAGFEGLVSLRALLMTKNDMEIVNADALHGMNHLDKLDLSYNQLRTLVDGTLEPMTIKDTTRWDQRRYLYLEGNPWNCTCSLQWLQDWLLENGFPKNDPECATPKREPLMTIDLCPLIHSGTPQGPRTGFSIQCVLTILLVTCISKVINQSW